MASEVSAPGKMMLLGDYGVLAGGLAMVAAVDRRATGKRVPRGEAQASKVVEAVIAKADVSLGEDISIDTSGFYDGEKKLGFGSSAAVAVVTASLALDAGDERVLKTAISGHRDANGGEGSGVDVAASYYGGVIATKKQPAEVTPLPSRLGKLQLSVLFTGSSASTSELVRAARTSAKWAQWSEVLMRLTEEGVKAYQRGQVERFLAVVSQYGRAMANLGEDAGVPIVTEQIEEIMRCANALGAAAKPSGAGGGDIVVMWSDTGDVAQKVAEQTNATVIDVRVDQRGLARR